MKLSKGGDIDISSTCIQRVRYISSSKTFCRIIEEKNPHLAADVTVLGGVPIVFWTSGGEFRDVIAVADFVGHVTQEVTTLQ